MADNPMPTNPSPASPSCCGAPGNCGYVLCPHIPKRDGGSGPDPASPSVHEPYTIWTATVPFRRDGTPVVGNMGSSARRCVILDIETFQRMLREHPTLASDATLFNLGEMA